jgi:hypothetical protein
MIGLAHPMIVIHDSALDQDLGLLWRDNALPVCWQAEPPCLGRLATAERRCYNGTRHER